MNTQANTDHVGNIISYISNLEIGTPTKGLRVPFTVQVEGNEKAGFVDSGSVISFVSGIPAEQKTDVLNSTLLAQLAASKAFDRWSDTENWYKKYVEVLGKIGWVIENFHFTKYSTGSASFKMDKVVLEILGAIATGNQAAVIKETIDALKALSDDDGRLVLFDTNSSDLTKGNFQIATAQSDGENVAMSMGGFYFKSTQAATRILWFSYKSADMKLFKADQKVVLNEEIYKKVRQAVIDKLGELASQYVADIEI